MLKELSVTNFKSWAKISKMPLAPITGLFGANSSGKTSILQLLLMLKQTVESPDRAQALIFGDEKTPANLGTFRDVVFQHEPAKTLSWRLLWEFAHPFAVTDPAHVKQVLFAGRELTFEAEVAEGTSGRLLVKRMSYEIADRRFTMQRQGVSETKYELHAEGADFQLVRNPGRPWPLPAPVKCYGFPDQVKAYFQNAGFLADLQLAFEEMFGRVYYLGPLREYPQRQYRWAGSEPADMGRRGERVVDALLAARQASITIPLGQGTKRPSLEVYVARWLKRLGLIHSFSVEAITDSNLYRVRVQRTPTSASVLITDVGFGVSQILPALVLCFYVPEGSTIVLEQPEIHLHPSVQAGLADVFIDAVKRRKVQIIFESHSEHLLRRLQRRVAEGDVAPESTALYFCQMNDGQSELTPLTVDLLGSIENWPKDFFGDEFGEMAAMTTAAMKRKKAMGQ
jgi:predicted ATPase